ncbi:MAG: methyltransferase domain-containing protein [Leadbetterella sp.]
MKKRSYEKELLDDDEIPTGDLFQNLKELEIINKRLGGHMAVWGCIESLVENVNSPITILEIGSGGGDNLRYVQKRKPQNTYVGVDLKSDCIQFSKDNSENILWICSPYQAFKQNEPADVIFNSLFCHHFEDEEIVEMLRWMYTNSKLGFGIADLHRHSLAYWGIKIITQLFSKSRLVKNDAPLSVKRGFTRKEWIYLLEKAGIQNYTIHWKWAFRFAITITK